MPLAYHRPYHRPYRVTSVSLVLLAVLAGLLLGAPSAVALVPAAAAVAPVPAPKAGLPAAIEPQNIDYVAQTACDPGFKPGTAALGQLLSATYPGVTVQGAYGCASDGVVSEHYEGRAIDWMTSLRVPAQAADANALIGWLLATDTAGNKFAMARRLGVMYIIWNNRIWGGWDGTWQPYNNCANLPQLSSDNACHRTHVHLSLTWNGATGHTSYWAAKVTSTDFGACRVADLNWAAPYPGYRATPCPRYDKVSAPAGASANLALLYRYSGAVLRYGSTGPVVSAVQTALGLSSSGSYLGLTQAAVTSWQQAHRLAGTGVVDAATWRALLAALGPVTAASHPIMCAGGASALATGNALTAGAGLCSADHRTSLRMLADGNLVVYRNNAAVWQSGTFQTAAGGSLLMQTDGNLVLYRANGTAAWWSGTSGQGPNGWLSVQNDGNTVVYNGGARWWTGIRN